MSTKILIDFALIQMPRKCTSRTCKKKGHPGELHKRGIRENGDEDEADRRAQIGCRCNGVETRSQQTSWSPGAGLAPLEYPH